MESKKIQIEIPVGCKAEWQEVDGKFVLVAVQDDEKDNRPVTERIKTFEDARKEVGRLVEGGNESLANLLCDYESNADNILTKGTLSYMKLCLIAAALNEGWEPQFTADEYRYYPWFCLYTQEEIDKMDEEKKKSLVLWGGSAGNGAYCGLAFALSNYAFSPMYPSFGSRLAVKTKELAVYFGQQFMDIWADYVFKPQVTE